MKGLFASNVKYILSQHLGKVFVCWLITLMIVNRLFPALFGIHWLSPIANYFIAAAIVFVGIIFVHKKMVEDFKRKYGDF